MKTLVDMMYTMIHFLNLSWVGLSSGPGMNEGGMNKLWGIKLETRWEIRFRYRNSDDMDRDSIDFL